MYFFSADRTCLNVIPDWLATSVKRRSVLVARAGRRQRFAEESDPKRARATIGARNLIVHRVQPLPIVTVGLAATPQLFGNVDLVSSISLPASGQISLAQLVVELGVLRL